MEGGRKITEREWERDWQSLETGMGLCYYQGALQGAFEECIALERALGLPADVHTSLYRRLEQWQRQIEELKNQEIHLALPYWLKRVRELEKHEEKLLNTLRNAEIYIYGMGPITVDELVEELRKGDSK